MAVLTSASTYVVLCVLIGLALGAGMTPLISLATASHQDLCTGVAFLGSLAGAVGSQRMLHFAAWPLSTQSAGPRVLLLQQLPAATACCAVLALPGVLVLSASSDAGTVSLLKSWVALSIHIGSISVAVLQLPFSREVRSLLVPLLAWALPSILTPTSGLGAILHGSLALQHPRSDSGWTAWVTLISPIVVLLSSGLLLQELRTNRR